MTSSINVEKIPAEQLCDRLLDEAGLSPRWVPSKIPAILTQSAVTLDLVNSRDNISDSHRESMEKFGDRVIKFARNTLYRNPRIGMSAFRAQHAIDRANGNCIAVHEIVSGTLSTSGMAKYALGTWDGKHASTQYMIRSNLVDADGQWGAEISQDDSDPEWRTFSGVYQQVLDENLVAAYFGGESGYPHLDDVTLVEPHAVSDLPPDDGNRTLVMPAATATLVYIATQTQKGGLEYADAAEVLKNYALQTTQ